MKNTNLVVVLGMHRSGTSAITRALLTLGVELGDNLMPGVQSINEKGFFEDQEITMFNEFELLKTLGFTWHSLSSISPDLFDRPEIRSLEVQAAELIKTKVTSAALFGLKDPRMCRLLPFWQRVFDQLQLCVTYVMAVRNPLSVAQSLAKRDGFHPVKSHLLWLIYELSAVSGTHGKDRIFIDYDVLMEDPVGQLCRIANVIGISLEELPIETIQKYSRDFLADELRHSRFSSADAERDQQILSPVRHALRLLKPLTTDEKSPSDPAFEKEWESLWGEFRLFTPFIELLSQREGQMAELSEGNRILTVQRDESRDLNVRLMSENKLLVAQRDQSYDLNVRLIEENKLLVAQLGEGLLGVIRRCFIRKN